uniref:DM13 domain-containing protein n=1 Tax=Acrobeloides nanus TaxID=290746 RepID=A0A914ED00_9BILA
MNYLAALKLDKTPPKPFCCINNPKKPNKGIVGRFYGAGSGPISIQDSRTVVFSNFELEGTKPPDAWIYAGKGEINQETGQKAFIVGRDTPQYHCSIHEDYTGENDLAAVLSEGQTVYDIDFISVFCYQYNVNFGNVRLHLDPDVVQVPPYIPPVRESPTLPIRTQC